MIPLTLSRLKVALMCQIYDLLNISTSVRDDLVSQSYFVPSKVATLIAVSPQQMMMVFITFDLLQLAFKVAAKCNPSALLFQPDATREDFIYKTTFFEIVTTLEICKCFSQRCLRLWLWTVK